MNRYFRVLIISMFMMLLVISPAVVKAQYYIGGSIGSAGIDLGGGADDDDTGIKIYGGYNFGQAFVEGGFADFGTQTFDGGVVFGDVDFEVTALGFYGGYDFLEGPADLFAKIGIVMWDADAESSLLGDLGSDDGNDLSYGIGGAYHFDGFAIRVEYEFYDIEDTDEVSLLSLGVTYHF